MKVETVERLYIRLKGEDRLGFDEFLYLFSSLLPFLNWSSEIWIDSDDLPSDLPKVEKIVENISSFLKENGFIRVNCVLVHPYSYEQKGILLKSYRRLHTLILPFQKEAYDNISESRLNLISVLKGNERALSTAIIPFIDLLKDIYVPCAMYLEGGLFNPLLPTDLFRRMERIFMELPHEGDGLIRLFRTIWANSLFDILHDKADRLKYSGLEGACPSHLVLDGSRGLIGSCWRDILENRGLIFIKKGVFSDEGVMDILSRRNFPSEICLSCMYLALRDMESTLRMNGREADGARVFSDIGSWFIKKGDYKRAISYLHLALKTEEDQKKKADIYVQIGLNQLKLGKMEKAIESLKVARSLHREWGIPDYYLGLISFQLKDYIEATDFFSWALEKGLPDDLLKDLYFYKGVSHINLNEFEEAIQAMEDAEGFGAERAPVLFYRAMGNLGKGDMEEAIKLFHHALHSNPDEDDLGRIMFYIAMCEKERGNYREALKWLKDAEQKEGPGYDIYNLMGFCHFKLKEHEEAISSFKEALKCAPESAIDYANIASNLRELGRYEEAMEMYRKALRLDPGIGFAKSNLERLENEFMRKK